MRDIVGASRNRHGLVAGSKIPKAGVGSGSGPRGNNPTIATATAGPGPSTVAAKTAAGQQGSGRKVPSSNILIELTDSESDGDGDGDERMAKRAKTDVVPATGGKSKSAVGRATTLSRRPAAPAPAPAINWAKGRGKANQHPVQNLPYPAPVPLFLDEEDEDLEIEPMPQRHMENSVDRWDHPVGTFPPPELHWGGFGGDIWQGIPLDGHNHVLQQPLLQGQQEPSTQLKPQLPQSPQPQQEPDPALTVDGLPSQPPAPTNSQSADADSIPENEDVINRYMAQILEIIPDVAPDYLVALLLQVPPQEKENTVTVVLSMLFDDPQYPKVDRTKGKGKRKSDAADDEGRQAKKPKINFDYMDYSRLDRERIGGDEYYILSVEHLQASFPYVPRGHVRKFLSENKCLYAPTHVYLAQLYKQIGHDPKGRPPMNGHGPDFPFTPRKTPFRPPGGESHKRDIQFEKEKKWVDAYDEEDGDVIRLRTRLLMDDNDEDTDGKGKGKEKQKSDDEDDNDDNDECPEGEGIECGCCFTEYSFEKMIQCPEGHLFCKSCIKTYSSNLLGGHDIRLKCMHQSGCTLLFPESELRRVLPQRLIDLYDRLKQQKEIEEADLEGLEECPFCDYKCVIEADKTQEKLFRCGNFDGGCGAVSCRECKRPDHLPKSCKEMDEDKVLNGQHVIEEAMSAALMRNCPKCKKPFIKESGCNKISCYTCGASSCYVCRALITSYGHFDERPGDLTSNKTGKCPLWDSLEARHAQEVKDAAEKALAEYKSENPDANHDSIKVDVPQLPKPPARPVNLPGIGAVLPHAHVARGRRNRGRHRGRAAPPPRVQQAQQVQPVAQLPPAPQLQNRLPPLMPHAPPAAYHYNPIQVNVYNPPQVAYHPHPQANLPRFVYDPLPPPPRIPGVGVPQAPAFGFHAPAFANPFPVQAQNLPPARGRQVQANVNPNPNPVPVPVQNVPARRQTRAGARAR